MNPFEELLANASKNEMTRSQSFDLSNAESCQFQQHTNISSVSNAIDHNPARMADFLGYHHVLNTKATKKLETIYENMPSSTQNIPLNFHLKPTTEQTSADKKILSMHGSVSSWNL